MNDEIKDAEDVIEETMKECVELSAKIKPPSDEKPLLNASRIHQFGTYRLFYDIQIVDKDQKIYKGRPVPEADLSKIPGARDMEKSWVLFTRKYSNDNEWDKVYPEYEIKDEEMFGQRILIVPKEKILFAYNPPPGAGIIIPMAGAIGRG